MGGTKAMIMELKLLLALSLWMQYGNVLCSKFAVNLVTSSKFCHDFYCTSAFNASRARCCFDKSIRLSNASQRMNNRQKCGNCYTFWWSGRGDVPVLWAPAPLLNSKGNPHSKGVKYILVSILDRDFWWSETCDSHLHVSVISLSAGTAQMNDTKAK